MPLNTIPSKSYASRSGQSAPFQSAVTDSTCGASYPASPSPLLTVSFHMKINEHTLPYVSQNPSHVALTYNQMQVPHGIAVTPLLHNILQVPPQELVHLLTVY